MCVCLCVFARVRVCVLVRPGCIVCASATIVCLFVWRSTGIGLLGRVHKKISKVSKAPSCRTNAMCCNLRWQVVD